LTASAKDILGSGESLEAVDAGGWVLGESFVDRATPRGESCVSERIDDRRRSYNVRVVVAA